MWGHPGRRYMREASDFTRNNFASAVRVGEEDREIRVVQDQLRAELERRLAAELKHREQSGRDLAEELAGPSPVSTTLCRRPYAVTGACTATPRGNGSGMQDQAAERELAETQRQMEEIQARLRGWGGGLRMRASPVEPPTEESAPSGPTGTGDGGELL